MKDILLKLTRVAKLKNNTYICIKKEMNTKLTLTIEKEVIEIAKEYAKEKGQSLSDIVENYFKLITNDRREMKADLLSPRVKRLRGIIKTDAPINYKEILAEELLKKSDYNGLQVF